MGKEEAESKKNPTLPVRHHKNRGFKENDIGDANQYGLIGHQPWQRAFKGCEDRC